MRCRREGEGGGGGEGGGEGRGAMPVLLFRSRPPVGPRCKSSNPAQQVALAAATCPRLSSKIYMYMSYTHKYIYIYIYVYIYVYIYYWARN